MTKSDPDVAKDSKIVLIHKVIEDKPIGEIERFRGDPNQTARVQGQRRRVCSMVSISKEHIRHMAVLEQCLLARFSLVAKAFL